MSFYFIGRAGQIINAILVAGFQVSAIGTVSQWYLWDIWFIFLSSFQFSLDKVNAEEFLEVYKGVVHEYSVNNYIFASHSSISLFFGRKWLKN